MANVAPSAVVGRAAQGSRQDTRGGVSVALQDAPGSATLSGFDSIALRRFADIRGAQRQCW
jgi:hypothetical protein